MFGTIRKHQKWLWIVIITLTIISFVIFFSPYSKLNESRGPANYGSINGQKVSEEQYALAQREVYLRYFLMNGRWPDDDARKSGFDALRETYQWLLLLQKIDEFDIRISSDVVAEFGRELLRPFERMGVTSPNVFFKQVLEPRGFGSGDFERYARHYLGIQELIATLGLSGKLVTPQEAKSLYEREHQELDTEAAFFSPSNYLASVSVTPEGIAQFYTNRLASYRVPERRQVAYVKFGLSNALAQAEAELTKSNLTEIVEANFQRLGTNYFPDAKTPEAVRAKIREELIRGRALPDVRRKAAEFAGPLVDADPQRAEDLEKAAKAAGLPYAVTAPFDREEGPKELEVGAEFLKAAFTRTTNDPFAGPLVGKDGVYVIALHKEVASYIPTLDEIRARVTEDYRYSQALLQARQAGMVFHTTLTNGLAQGKPFSALCLDAKLKPVLLPPFSLSTRSLPAVEDLINLNHLKQIAFSTAPGKVSEFQPTVEGGVIVLVKSKLPLDEKKMNDDLPRFVAYVRQTRQNEAFNKWFNKEAERALRDTPLARPQTPPAMNGSGPAKS